MTAEKLARRLPAMIFLSPVVALESASQKVRIAISRFPRLELQDERLTTLCLTAGVKEDDVHGRRHKSRIRWSTYRMYEVGRSMLKTIPNEQMPPVSQDGSSSNHGDQILIQMAN